MLVFIVDGDQVRLISAEQLLLATWADNHGGDAGDSVTDVRASREHDREVERDAAARIDADVAGSADRDPDELASELLDALGLDR